MADEIKKKKILIVDDEPDIAMMIKLRLEANNYETIIASDGEAGYNKARKDAPDLIILDLMLPRIDGYRVCGLLKKDTNYTRIPIILLTAKAQAEDMRLGQEVGADAYMVKPFKPQELLDKIKELLDR